jgi:hypothetical protein
MAMKHTLELQTAIESLYTIFAEYPLRANTDPCPCCHSAHDEELLHMKPLRKLSTGDLRQFATDALSVWGGSDDLKHFLPRILELSVEQPDTFVDPQVALNKLQYGDWRSWPAKEQRGIEQFLVAMWDSVLDTEHDFWDWEVEDWLCGVAQAEAQLSPYLARWLAADSDNARLNLAAFIANTDFAKLIQVPENYWSARSELFWEVAAWVRSEAVKIKMSNIVADFPQYDFVERAYISLP